MKKILLILLILLSCGIASAETNYYYANISISNNPNIVDYQTYTDIDFRNGMNPDFSNIRMFDSGVEIPYYIQNYTTSSARVWYQVDPTSQIQCRWGIQNETISKSNASAVMDFADEFNDLSKWSGDTGRFSISNGNLQSSPTTGSIYTTISGGIDGKIIEARIKSDDTPTDLVFGLSAKSSANAWKVCRRDASGYPCRWGDAGTYYSSVPPQWTSNVYGIDTLKISSNGANVICMFNGETILGVTASNIDSFLTAGQISIYQYGTTTAQYVDWVIVREYAAIEPTTSIGATQTFSDAPQYIPKFDILGMISSPYTNILGSYFWVIFGIIPVFMMYLKSQDVVIPTMCGILFTAAFGMTFPQNLGIALLMLLSTAVGAIFFKVFKGDGN